MLPSIESIKQQRLKINMTQKELARLVGVSTSMINQIESGRSAQVIILQKEYLKC